MIARVEFLQDIPLEQNGFGRNRSFWANDGWQIDVFDGAVQLTRDGKSFVVENVPFVAHLAEPALPAAALPEAEIVDAPPAQITIDTKKRKGKRS